MPIISGISIFMSMKMFMLSWVEHEKCFRTSGLGFISIALNQVFANLTVCPLESIHTVCRISASVTMLICKRIQLKHISWIKVLPTSYFCMPLSCGHGQQSKRKEHRPLR